MTLQLTAPLILIVTAVTPAVPVGRCFLSLPGLAILNMQPVCSHGNPELHQTIPRWDSVSKSVLDREDSTSVSGAFDSKCAAL